MSEEFAQILNSIERNDGFEEEDLPVDPDGIPLSHKTKHVMDAIMRNSGVSPSLVYGRRRAAEKNVIIDESFLEKKEGKGGDNGEELRRFPSGFSCLDVPCTTTVNRDFCLQFDRQTICKLISAD